MFKLSAKRVSLGAALMVAVILTLGLVSGCNSTKNDAATVDGEHITEKALDAEVAKLKLQSPSLFDKNSGGMDEGTIRSTLLDELIAQQLLSKEAQEKHVNISDSEIDKNIESLKAGYSDEKQFEDALKTAGYSLNTLREQVKWQLLSTKLLEKLVPASSVSEKEAQAYYNKNKASYKVAAAKRSSHILFASKDEATAKKVLKELQDGADFAAMAKKYSTDTASAKNGGDLGWPAQAYVTEFQQAVDKLSKGQMSGLVKSAYGWHIIKVTDTRKAGQQSFADAKESVIQTLLSNKRSQAYQTLVSDLRKKAKVVIYDAQVKESKAKTKTTSTLGGTGTQQSGTSSSGN